MTRLHLRSYITEFRKNHIAFNKIYKIKAFDLLNHYLKDYMFKTITNLHIHDTGDWGPVLIPRELISGTNIKTINSKLRF